MKNIARIIRGDIFISEDTLLSGIVNGSITVAENTIFNLSGILNGRLFLKEKATVYLSGMVSGDIVNNGGYLEISGTINGNIIRQQGQIIVKPEAIINESRTKFNNFFPLR